MADSNITHSKKMKPMIISYIFIYIYMCVCVCVCVCVFVCVCVCVQRYKKDLGRFKISSKKFRKITR